MRLFSGRRILEVAVPSWDSASYIKARGEVVWSSPAVDGKLQGWQRKPSKYKESKFREYWKSKQRATWHCTWDLQAVHIWDNPVFFSSVPLSHQGRCSCVFKKILTDLYCPSVAARGLVPGPLESNISMLLCSMKCGVAYNFCTCFCELYYLCIIYNVWHKADAVSLVVKLYL